MISSGADMRLQGPLHAVIFTGVVFDRTVSTMTVHLDDEEGFLQQVNHFLTTFFPCHILVPMGMRMPIRVLIDEDSYSHCSCTLMF